MVVCESSQKPLMFLHLVFDRNVTEALVFTKSAESTTRLVQLFDFFKEWRKIVSKQPPLVVRAYSSDLPVGERKAILEQFKAQEINMYGQSHPHLASPSHSTLASSVLISFQEVSISAMFHMWLVMMLPLTCASMCIEWGGPRGQEGMVVHGPW